jgi:hypothetical protein
MAGHKNQNTDHISAEEKAILSERQDMWGKFIMFLIISGAGIVVILAAMALFLL